VERIEADDGAITLHGSKAALASGLLSPPLAVRAGAQFRTRLVVLAV